MKKIFFGVILVTVLAALSIGVALAKTEKINVEGEVIAVDEVNQTITIRTAEGEKCEVHFPEGEFSYTLEDMGALVHVKGELQADGTILVIWVKTVYGEEDGDKQDNPYCSGEKETPHPVAIVLVNVFDKDVEEIMAYFCDGFGFGQLFLALQTEVIAEVEYGTLLEERSEGKGWGEIWKDLGYNGKPKDKNKDKAPPDQDKDKDKDKDKGKDKSSPGQDKDDDKDKNPPGQEKDKTKVKKPKKDKDK